MRSPRALVAITLAAILTAACGDSGPTYPTVFEPVALQADLSAADATMASPATESFALVGDAIDAALAGQGGVAVVDLPALMLADEDASSTPARKVVARARLLASSSTANAIPAAALGKTFVYDAATDTYVVSQLAGAPANGVRFILYAVDPITGLIVEPVVAIGHVDLSRTANNNSATARLEVFSGTAAPTRVLDYTASVAGTVTTPTITVAGFARNATDSLAFVLTASVSLASESVNLDWRTALPSRQLVSRIRQNFRAEGDVGFFSIASYLQSANGRVDIGGTIAELTGGTLTVKVNGQTFATMTLTAGSDEDPTITGAGGEPLTAEEAAMLHDIFTWFVSAFILFIALMAPAGTILDGAF